MFYVSIYISNTIYTKIEYRAISSSIYWRVIIQLQWEKREKYLYYEWSFRIWTNETEKVWFVAAEWSSGYSSVKFHQKLSSFNFVL